MCSVVLMTNRALPHCRVVKAGGPVMNRVSAVLSVQGVVSERQRGLGKSVNAL